MIHRKTHFLHFEFSQLSLQLLKQLNHFTLISFVQIHMDKNVFYIVGTILFDPTHPMWLKQNIIFGDSGPKMFWVTSIWQLDGIAKFYIRMNILIRYQKQASDPILKAGSYYPLKFSFFSKNCYRYHTVQCTLRIKAVLISGSYDFGLNNFFCCIIKATHFELDTKKGGGVTLFIMLYLTFLVIFSQLQKILQWFWCHSSLLKLLSYICERFY